MRNPQISDAPIRFESAKELCGEWSNEHLTRTSLLWKGPVYQDRFPEDIPMRVVVKGVRPFRVRGTLYVMLSPKIMPFVFLSTDCVVNGHPMTRGQVVGFGAVTIIHSEDGQALYSPGQYKNHTSKALRKQVSKQWKAIAASPTNDRVAPLWSFGDVQMHDTDLDPLQQ